MKRTNGARPHLTWKYQQRTFLAIHIFKVAGAQIHNAKTQIEDNIDKVTYSS